MSNDFLNENFAKLKFSYYQCGITKLNDQWNYKNQQNPFSICYYSIEGKFKISAAGEEIVVTPGMLVIIPAGIVFDLSCPFSDAATQYWLHFNLYANQQDIFAAFSKPIVISDPPPLVESLFSDIVRHSTDNNIISQCLLNASCYTLMSLILEKIGFDIIYTLQDTDYLISQIVNYIQEHYTEPLAVETLAQKCHFNLSYFIRIFKKKMGVTPHRYIQSLQIELAREYLKNSSLPIKNIASAVGFSGEKHFSKIFKACTNLSPTAFRQKHTNFSEFEK